MYIPTELEEGEGIYKIYLEANDDIHTLISEHDFDEYHHSDYFVRKTCDDFFKNWGKYPNKLKYKLQGERKWTKVDVKHYVF